MNAAASASPHAYLANDVQTSPVFLCTLRVSYRAVVRSPGVAVRYVLPVLLTS